MKKIYKGIDLFCGIGGFRLAMKSNNVKCVFSSDNDKFAQQTYEANFHEIANLANNQARFCKSLYPKDTHLLPI